MGRKALLSCCKSRSASPTNTELPPEDCHEKNRCETDCGDRTELSVTKRKGDVFVWQLGLCEGHNVGGEEKNVAVQMTNEKEQEKAGMDRRTHGKRTSSASAVSPR